MQLKAIADLLHLTCEHDAPITMVGIDSREIQAGGLFIAIRGERLDGHDYALEAERRGAAAMIGEHVVEYLTIPQFIVPDTQKALGIIAQWHRRQFNIPVIALTGSNGKTSVKEMIYQILPKPALATLGNLNNHLGVPLSLLKLNASHRAAVLELGANHLGEIAYTSQLVHPDVALVNNIGPAHIGEFGSIEAIAKTKGEIYDSLGPHGVAVVNDDDDYAHFWDRALNQHQCMRFSQHHPADIYATEVQCDDQGFPSFTLHLPNFDPYRISLNVPGRHNVSNALAAAACTYALDIEPEAIIRGLTEFQGVHGRLHVKKGLHEAVIIDDTYNANLRSALAAIDVLAQQKGHRILVIGNMAELGDETIPHHQKIGQAATEEKIDELLSYGNFAKASAEAFLPGGVHFESQLDLIEAIKSKLNKGVVVLIKGSRSSQMEKVVDALIDPN